MTLNELKLNHKCSITSLLSDGCQRRRMLDLGLVEGTKVEAVLSSPFGEPIAYLIRGALIALRKEDAQLIEIERL